MAEISLTIWAFAVAISLCAGLVKGVVGFAMPMIMISGLASVMAPELALALLILPTLATNLWQALRGGVRAVWDAARHHWRYLTIVCIGILASAQLVRILPQTALFLILGIPVVGFAVSQLAGWRPRMPKSGRRAFEFGIAVVAGVFGGISGVWGPPTVIYLTALDIPKAESVRVQGVVYGSGALMLVAGHIRSGVLTFETAQASALMILPALAGLAIGFRIQDRIDQTLFRRLTLVVLVLAGLNLIRRGVFGA